MKQHTLNTNAKQIGVLAFFELCFRLASQSYFFQQVISEITAFAQVRLQASIMWRALFFKPRA
jgi:hypothetical protein